MSKSPSAFFFREQGLLPYQADFAADFLAPDAPRHWEWLLPVGAGKNYTAAAIIGYIAGKNSEARILILAPRALLEQWSYALKRRSLPASPMIVDRRAFLELEANVAVEGNPWPAPGVIVMSIDLAKRIDMARAINCASWDLVVIDESQQLGGQRRRLVNQLLARERFDRALLLTGMPGEQTAGVIRRVTDLASVVDWDGNELLRRHEPKLEQLTYQRSLGELKLLDGVNHLGEDLTQELPYGQLQAVAVLRAAQSSPLSLEAVLQRLGDGLRPIRNKLVHELSPTPDDFENLLERLDSLTELDELLPEEQAKGHLETATVLSLLRLTNELLTQLEELETDAKLDRVLTHLRSAQGETLHGVDHRHIAVLTTYISTARYLESSLVADNLKVISLTGSTAIEERQERLSKFKSAGGVLVATDAALQGIGLPYVTQCINYDLPWSPQALEFRWGRFLRFGRELGFQMFVLRDETGDFPADDLILRLVEKQENMGQEFEEE